MLNDLGRALGRLRETLSNRAEQAYTDRDDKDKTDRARNFAAGEAHAYSIAEMDVRDVQKERDDEA